jgi:rhomboid protease GluP
MSESADSAALYLAKVMVADHRYRPLDLPEAAPLTEVSDIVLVGGDGVGLAIACIIDRDADPTKKFTMAPERVDEIAAACAKHSGSVYGGKEDVIVEIWEVGAGVPDVEDRARMERYAFRRATHKGVGIRGYAVNTVANIGSQGALWSTAADASTRQEWVRNALRNPRRSDNELAHAAQSHDKVARFDTRPYATYALIAAFVTVFIAEFTWTLAPANGASPNIATLIALGGLEHRLTEGGEWWRMLTCAFLHGDPFHLLFNCVAMYMAGAVLENLIGRRWMLGLFVIGALGGSFASLSVNPDHITSVGASGAIMALLAAAMVASLRLPKGPARMQIMVSLGQILIPGLLPLATHGGKVDFGAHLGGAIAGALGGLALYVTWPRDAEHPRAGMFAAVVAAAGLAYTAFGWSQLAADHARYKETLASTAMIAHNPKLLEELVPDDKLPKNEAATPERIAELLADYPRDPRIRLQAGAIALDAGEYAKARNHVEAAIGDREMLRLLVDPVAYEAYLRWLLAMTHESENNATAAAEAVAPSCAHGIAASDAEMRAFYQRLCK